MVFGCVWNPYRQGPVHAMAGPENEAPSKTSSFITFGKNHLCFWEYLHGLQSVA